MTEPRPDRLDAPLVRLLVVLALGAMMAALDATIVNVGIRTIAASLHAPLSTIEWVSVGYLLAVSVAVPVSGWVVDRVGGRRVWLTVLTGFVLASALAAAAWSVGSLIAFRVVQGAAGGMLGPTMLTMLARAAGPGRAGRALGLASVPVALGPVLGPVLGGVIVAHLPWRWIFLVNVPVGVLALALALRVVPRDSPARGTTRPLDVVGLVLLGPGFAAVAYALSQAGSSGFAAAKVVVALSIAVVLLGCYGWHAFHTAAPLIDLRLFASRGFTASVIAMSLSGALVFSPMFLLPLYYQQVRGAGALGAGLLLAPLGAGAFISMPLAGQLADRLGPRRLVPFGAALAGVTMFAYTQAGPTIGEVALAGCLLGYGFGLGFVDVPTMSSVYRTVPAAATSSATGTLYILNQTFASLGVAVVALQLQSPVHHTPVIAGYQDAFWWIAATAATALLASLWLPGHSTRPTAHTTKPAEETDPPQHQAIHGA
jgi:EmrB/QacA subfamily drug resistance transporter